MRSPAAHKQNVLGFLRQHGQALSLKGAVLQNLFRASSIKQTVILLILPGYKNILKIILRDRNDHMPWIKGLVLLSRFEYLEKKYGTTVYQEFLDTISTADHNFAKQPVDTANLYADDLLVAIDQKLLEVHFKRDLEEFRKLGQWNAQNLMPKYFQLYLSEQKPVDFLDQFSVCARC